MSLFRRAATTERSRFDCLRALYRKFRAENTREARGLRLLRDWLSPAQRAQFEAKGYFDVIGSDSGRKYRIYEGTMTNVYELDEIGRPRMGWCFVPSGYLVAGDVMLAQKIALETAESASLAVANRFLPKAAQFRVLR
ncbi:hypothetical protein [Bradyrhizobium sp. ARR65]|uniref:hypothetical protein n=1 Tax=unclassified Bradyrhizobium TaxID=2631580 RepID=UPI0004664269|nr:hypothetical protein [Bradyrhizobium sp. ARR65]